jgi:orotidine-5'-phosphate decarboxylase
VLLQAADRLLRRPPRRGPARGADRAHPRRHPDTPVILDAKRGDIGSTAEQYAIEAFERFKADAITVNPYMGRDSVDPYLAYPTRA